jgi:hypothetical protein
MTVTVLPRGRFSVVTGIPPFFVPPTWNTIARGWDESPRAREARARLFV